VAQKKENSKLADDGTIFLDEIGDIPPKLQLDLLRVLQEKSFYRSGARRRSESRPESLRDECNLQEAVREGVFREDLYYRLNVINIRIPPLRERLEDIPLLAHHSSSNSRSSSAKRSSTSRSPPSGCL